MENELKPCPFCGGIGKMGKENYNGFGYSYTKYFVTCSKCGARSKPVDDYCEKVKFSKVVSYWNARINK